MAISVPRPDPTSPASVAAASFSTTRRGFDPAEVRELLRAVSAELARLLEREKFLERELEAVRQRSAMAPAQLDEDTVAALLGEETARIVQTAREAAAQIRARAEEAAARLLREATEEAARLRESAELDAARKRQDAAADAELELESAKQHGRDMVNEAREYREKVLADVARRRELARQQIEQLVHGRDRLLQAFERARLAAVDVVAELGSLGEEPAEFVNLSPTTGPVPLVAPSAPPPTAAAPTAPLTAAEPDVAEEVEEVEEVEVQLFDGESTFDDLSESPPAEESLDESVKAQPSADGELVEEAVEEVAADAVAGGPAPGEAELGRVVELRRAEPPAPAEDEVLDDDLDEVDDDVDDEVDDERAPAPVVALFAGEVDGPKPNVDDLFAKLRAASAEMVAREATESLGGSTEHALAASDHGAETPFARRDEALVPLILAMGRKLKRALADEQNDVLDTLRRKEPVTTLDALVPDPQAHGERYRSAIDAEITDAAMAGAQSLSDDPLRELRTALDEPGVLAPVTEAIVTDIVEPLRERLARCVEQAGGDNASLSTLVRAVYREWKTQRIDEQVDDVARLAYGRGAFAVLAPGLRVCWLVDPDGPACPDAEDNALGGVIAAGEPFPTGHTHPPAHSGCRCLLARADD